jgi:hypothetical protein
LSRPEGPDGSGGFVSASGSETPVRRQSLLRSFFILSGAHRPRTKRTRAGVRGVFRVALVREGRDGGRRKRRGDGEAAGGRRKGAVRLRQARSERGGRPPSRAGGSLCGRPCFSARETPTRFRPGARSPPPRRLLVRLLLPPSGLGPARRPSSRFFFVVHSTTPRVAPSVVL